VPPEVAEEKKRTAEDAEASRRTLRKEGWLASETVYNPGDPVTHMQNIEIEKVAELEAAETEIAQELRAMNRKKCLDSLQLDHHPILDQQIIRYPFWIARPS
jgi:hypothetical protein